ncbi:MAG: radical SAM protein [Verrucomicrobiae bacterium]|nr:radical SAM protein [Verrucomicrobiae bacterium]MCB1091037.1 radical SAM protein [Verrucomicrobiae bacterium]
MKSPPFGPLDLARSPFILFWEITRACALACRHCRATAMPRMAPDQLNHEESLRLIDEIARLDPKMLVLTGGDPMMRPDLLDLIRHAHGSHGIHTSLSPSATPLLLRTDFHELKSAGVQRMSLSLDGANRPSHDDFRGVSHTFDRTLQAVEKAHQADIPVQINTTIHRGNIHELEDFADLMFQLRPAMWSVFLIVPTGRAAMEDLPEPEEVEWMLERLYQIAKEAPFDVKTTEAHHYRRVVVQHERSADRVVRRAPPGIRDGRGVAFISHTGDISPSGFLPIVAGNVRHDSLCEVYRNHPLFVNLRDHDRLKGKCGQCEFRTLCGGSRSRALSVHGDVFAQDPLCSYQPKLASMN